ncbi:hypothetical protein CGMCC3_g14165 [Colletotrichum fructicola]|nr:uncharacterized protein CGMCC3_g14165 [Colletotrichum fructicola]KAE9569755.1 hypothetical protein CGMCC3_g14165 [Colletotrichum fructicola]
MIKFIVDLNNGSSIRFMNLCPSAGLPRTPVPGPKIVLVDARSEYHGLSMAGVKSWDDLATFIERLFCVGGQSCLAVKNRSYILRNNTTEEMFLVNSPSIPPLEDSVQDGHELEMSMLFPNHTDYNSFCPKCKRFWSNPVSMEMFCTRCGLSARFLDSFDDEPDPVTSLALKDIRRTGLRLVIEQTMLGFGEREPKKMKNQEMLYEQTMNALAKSKNELGPRPMAPARNDKSEIKDFRRITLCSEQWPDFARALSAANWNNNRARAIVRGLKHFLAAKTFSESALAFIVNNSIIGTRRGPETAFLQVQAHTYLLTANRKKESKISDQRRGRSMTCSGLGLLNPGPNSYSYSKYLASPCNRGDGNILGRHIYKQVKLVLEILLPTLRLLDSNAVQGTVTILTTDS